jgi:branched-chain amino acid transport system ATP-binding protein
MRAAEIIAAEHRNMWRVVNALGVLADRIEAGPLADDLHTIALIADYLDGFSERFHHPKESDLLFARMRRRSNAAAQTLDRLDHDHRESPHQVLRIRDLAAAGDPRDLARIATLAGEIRSYRGRLGEHMRIEDETVLPLAREILRDEDWVEIDAAFAAHQDPLGAPDAAADIALLRARITQLLPAPEGLGGHSEAVLEKLPQRNLAKSGTLLDIAGLVCRYGRIEALHGVDIKVGAGELVALVGANGAGKTTLLRAISGVQPTAAGMIRFDGVDMTRVRPSARVRAGIAQVPEGRQVFGPMSIQDNLELGAYLRPASEIRAAMDEVFDLFPILRERRALPAGTLSGGQQQMLAVGRALMSRPKLLLLDEPSMGLAPLIVEEIFRIVKMLKESGMTILLVEQNARAALALADHAYVLETGAVTIEGPGDQLLANDAVRQAYLGM